MDYNLDETSLRFLETLSDLADPPPWIAWIEGRNELVGDSFIQAGQADDRAEDIYVTRDSGPAAPRDLDLIAAARTYLPLLLAEVRSLRAELSSHDR